METVQDKTYDENLYYSFNHYFQSKLYSYLRMVIGYGTETLDEVNEAKGQAGLFALVEDKKEFEAYTF